MYVYFVKAWGECPLIKIGKANDPEARIRQLQTGCPFKLNLLGTVRCKSEEHAKQVEKMAHRIFRKQRRRGEWFRLSKKHRAQIASLIERASGANPLVEVRQVYLDERPMTVEEIAWERAAWERFEAF